MAREFPTYPSHDAARCFACGHALHSYELSGMPRRQGEWKAECGACGKQTWYDLPQTPEDIQRDGREWPDGFPESATRKDG